MSVLSETQQRWDIFLSKIEARFHEILSQAEGLLPGILELQDFDTTPFAVAWQGIDTQMKDLISKIGETWQEKVSLSFDDVKEREVQALTDAGKPLDGYYKTYYGFYYKEQGKGFDLMRKLEREKKGYEVRTFAEAARKLRAEVARVLSRSFTCTQCKAPLQVRTNFFRSYYQACEYCQTVNTFEPSTIARNVEHFALHPLAEEKALEEYFVYEDVERRFRDQRDDAPLEVTKEMVLEAQKKYAEKYLKARIEIIPEYEKEYEKDLASKIEHVRKWVLGEHEWHATNAAARNEKVDEDEDCEENDFEDDNDE